MKRTRLLQRKRQSRNGAIIILTAILSIVLIGMVAFSVDIGYVLSAKEELQRSADAAALAACWEYGQKLAKGNTEDSSVSAARTTAANYAALNRVTGNAVSLDSNAGNSPNGDVVFGYISNFKNSQSAFQTNSTNGINAIRVRLRKDSSMNGEVPYFFARVFGMEGQVLESEAIAGMIRDVRGFQAPANGENVDILPYALDLDTWNELVAGNSSDNYCWNAEGKSIGSGSDGFVEVNLFPQGTGSPGNRGTIDIGGANNSTSDIARQILHGISPEDFAAHAANGRSLEFDEGGALYLNGDTGISSGVKDELIAIKGQPRVIPIFETVTQNGNNAEYKIVRWQGIRIMAVKLTGSMSQKHVTIQVAPVLVNGVIPSTTTGTSQYVYSPVVLVR
jgi:Flp pilus assembly protein TadG